MATNVTLMSSDQFNTFFSQAVGDAAFREELRTDGFGALERHGYSQTVAPEIQEALQATEVQAVSGNRCGVCGVCGLCTLCAEINAGSASAALWATFALA